MTDSLDESNRQLLFNRATKSPRGSKEAPNESQTQQPSSPKPMRSDQGANRSEELNSVDNLRDVLLGDETVKPLSAKDPDIDIENLKFDTLDLTSSSFLNEIEETDIDAFLEDALVQDAIKQGQDIAEYSKRVRKELLTVERESVLDYYNERDKFAELYIKMNACDEILAKLETLLSTFQESLSAITTQIQDMQQVSNEKDIKLNNRKNVATELQKFIAGVKISPNLAKAITSPTVDTTFLEAVTELTSKIAFLENHKSLDVIALREAEAKITQLKLKASQKIYQWLTSKLHIAMKNLDTLAKTQKELIKYKNLFPFLSSNDPEKAIAIVDGYCEAVSKMYYQHFKSYLASISKLQYEVASKNDLIGVEDDKIKNFFTSKIVMKNRSNVFSMGNRYKKALSDLEKPTEFPVVVNEKKFPFEYLFRCVNYMLMQNVCEEMIFVKEFFVLDLCERIFGKTIEVYNNAIQNYLSNSYDSVGILLIQCIIDKYRQIMNERTEYGLNVYFDVVSQMLLQRFKFVFQLNVESLKNASAKTLGPVDIHPHYVTRRYAEYLTSVLFLLREHNSALKAFKLSEQLKGMREEMEALLERLSQTFKTKRDQLIFLINNLDLILTITAEQNVTSEDVERFVRLHKINCDALIDMHLSLYFNNIITFVRNNTKIESQNATNNTNSISSSNTNSLVSTIQVLNYQPKVEDKDLIFALLKEFSITWKQSIEEIHRIIISSFSNFKNGTQILQNLLKQLFTNYKIFADIIRQYFKEFRDSPYFVSETEIAYEMKKYILFDDK
jgi:hypothetical protein